MLIGQITRVKGQGWMAVCESVGAYTQGRSRKGAVAMLADCIETKVNRPTFKVVVSVLADDGVTVLVEANEPALLIAEVLKHQRGVHGLSLAHVSRKLGPSSRSEYLRYEQGRSEPSVSTFRKILGIVAPEMALVVGPRAPRRRAR